MGNFVMFGNFSNSAIETVSIAQQEAQTAKHAAVQPEHLLLAVMQTQRIRALCQPFALHLPDVRHKVQLMFRPCAVVPDEAALIPFSDRTMFLFAALESKSDVEIIDILDVLVTAAPEGCGVLIADSGVDLPTLRRSIETEVRIKTETRGSGTAEYKQGDVVIVLVNDFFAKPRRRPAIIISNDVNSNDLFVLPLRAVTGDDPPDAIKIEMSSPEGQAAGLRTDSLIDIDYVYTIEKTEVYARIGRIRVETLTEALKRLWEKIRPLED